MLPRITGLTYEPTKVMNSKVYEIRVDVAVSSPAGRLSSVQVALEPVIYTQLPVEAFPNEQPKATMLQTTGLESELLSTQFAGLKGGREYDVKASGLGIEERTLRTEYVREFENIPSDNILVGTEYADFWWSEYKYPYGNWWNPRTNKPAVMRQPLLGYYDSRDISVFDKHIDWATGHGIDFFMMVWVCPSNYPAPRGQEHQPRIDLNFRDLLNKSHLLNSGEIEFTLLYDPLINIVELGRYEMDERIGDHWGMDLGKSQNRETLLGDFRYMSQYFSHPAWLRINGKPLLYVFGAPLFIGRDLSSEPARKVFSEIRRELGVFLVGDFGLVGYLPSQGTESARLRAYVELAEAFDGVSDFLPFKPNPEQRSMDHVRRTYGEWSKYGRQKGFALIPTTSPGYDTTNRYAPDPPMMVMPRSLQDFSGRTRVGLDYLDPKIRTLLITSFNDWYEDTMIEPGKEYGFQYLQVLKDELFGKSVSVSTNTP
jgi:hypothetical protein